METDRTRMSRIEELQMKEHGHVAEVPLIVHYTSVVAFLVNVLQLLTSSTTLERRERKRNESVQNCFIFQYSIHI